MYGAWGKCSGMMMIFDSLIDIAILGGQSVMCSVVCDVYAGSKSKITTLQVAFL